LLEDYNRLCLILFFFYVFDACVAAVVLFAGMLWLKFGVICGLDNLALKRQQGLG